MQVHNQNNCLELHIHLLNLRSHLPKLLRKTYFIIFNSLGQQSSRKEFHFVLFQTLKKIAGKILTVAFVSGANTYICQLWNWIVQAVKRIKLMVENGDEIDMNPSPEYQDTMSSTSTTTLFSQPDPLKFISICVIYWNIVLISTFQHGVPIWFYTNSVCTAEGKRRWVTSWPVNGSPASLMRWERNDHV